MDSNTLWELSKEKTYDEKERIVTYFMWYLFNVWNIAESKAVFGYQLGIHIYKKYVEYVFDNRMDVLRWYSELDTDCKTKLVNRAWRFITTNKKSDDIKMKKVKFTNKAKNESKVYFVGNVGQYVFACVNNVKETNDAIRWCNTHKVGDKFDCDAYTLEIIEE